MDKLKLVEKLKEKCSISYEEAKIVLENNDWDILESILYLERIGKVKGPSVSEYYTNEESESYRHEEANSSINEEKDFFNSEEKESYDGVFERIFEIICKYIDLFNNIFIEVKRHERVLIKLPVTVLIVLFIFGFMFVIPLSIVGLFFDIKYSVVSTHFDGTKVNDVLEEISHLVLEIKERFRKGSI